MLLTLLKSKIHRANVVQADLNYVGSITVDADILAAVGILEYEAVHVVNVNNGSRLETYAIAGKRGSGMICLNGPAARLACVGDTVIIMAYCQLSPEEARQHHPQVAIMTAENKIAQLMNYERHGVSL